MLYTYMNSTKSLNNLQNKIIKIKYKNTFEFEKCLQILNNNLVLNRFFYHYKKLSKIHNYVF